MSGFLTTHVLDTAHGTPAVGMNVVLYRFKGETRRTIATMTTNSDGRTSRPILPPDAFNAGRYCLEFHVADYFRHIGSVLADPPFLDIVPVCFGMADSKAHYHVPLLVSPYGYSTYRGS